MTAYTGLTVERQKNIERGKTMSANLIETVEDLGIPEAPEERERFRIETKDQAIWALTITERPEKFSVEVV